MAIVGPGTHASEDPAVSVVVPSYRMRRSLRSCLDSLLAQDTAAPYEVIVVDSSGDDSAAMVRTRFPAVQLVVVGERMHAAAARNLGVGIARAKTLAFIDADCTAEPDWISSLLRAHAAGHELVGGAISPATPRTIPGLVLFVIQFAEFLPRRGVRRVRFVPSCNLSIRADVLAVVGLFPAEFPRAHDLVLCWRYRRLGRGPIRFDPSVRIRHAANASLRTLRERVALMGRHSARVRRAGEEDGAWGASTLLRHPFLTPCVVPIRYALMLGRILRSPEARWLVGPYLLATPLVLAALALWARAFFAELAEGPPRDSRPAAVSVR